MHYNWEVVYS